MYRRKRIVGFCVVSTALWTAAVSVAQAEEPHAVQLSARDGRFYPDTLKVPAGQRVKIVFRNEGSGVEEFHSNDLRREEVALPGGTSTFVLAPLRPGVYHFIGELHPHTAKGRLIVE